MFKRLLILLIFFQFFNFTSANEVEVYNVKNKFGLKQGDKIITQAKYLKLISLRQKSYLFLYKNKYGIIDKQGNILLDAKYTNASRYIGRFVKLGNNRKFGIWDETGANIIPQEYSQIELLYGQMFLVKKNYKYGLIGFDGKTILEPIADDIYMPKKNIIRISINSTWYEIEQVNKEALKLPEDITKIDEAHGFNISSIASNPITSAGYGVVSVSDYLIKIFSSISPSYEQTIDDLVLGYGADTANILIKSSWLVKFPFVYGRNYYNNIKTPNNGPFSDIKSSLKNKLDD